MSPIQPGEAVPSSQRQPLFMRLLLQVGKLRQQRLQATDRYHRCELRLQLLGGVLPSPHLPDQQAVCDTENLASRAATTGSTAHFSALNDSAHGISRPIHIRTHGRHRVALLLQRQNS